MTRLNFTFTQKIILGNLKIYAIKNKLELFFLKRPLIR